MSLSVVALSAAVRQSPPKLKWNSHRGVVICVQFCVKLCLTVHHPGPCKKKPQHTVRSPHSPEKHRSLSGAPRAVCLHVVYPPPCRVCCVRESWREIQPERDRHLIKQDSCQRRHWGGRIDCAEGSRKWPFVHRFCGKQIIFLCRTICRWRIQDLCEGGKRYFADVAQRSRGGGKNLGLKIGGEGANPWTPPPPKERYMLYQYKLFDPPLPEIRIWY